ncbi:MAG: hypothetical protein CEE43_16285 [Promethearchaeota archaeon Loki_b32]|nr:MAG: hypothetical protein CEE43_16285 [Candidatus Lokiarchaeota archaeon Loki_b32]
MAKKKKKEKKKKPQEKKKKPQEKEKKVDQIPEYSLDSALSSARTTETTLQTLLKGVSEGKGFVHPSKGGKVKVTPQLTHESKSKIAEAYVMEDIPLTQRAQDHKQPRTTLVPMAKEKATTPKKSIGSKTAPQESKVEVSTPAKPQTIPEKTVKPPVEKEKAEELPTIPSTKKEPSFVKKESIYLKLTEFFEGLLMGYNENYDRWEMSISNILGILRKMRKITKKNTDDLVVSINNIFEKIQANLEQFKVKRNEIEKVAEVDIETMSGEFKQVLGLLELQIKEYQLKRVTDDFVHELKYYL